MTNNVGEKTLVCSCVFFLLALLLFCKYKKYHMKNTIIINYMLNTLYIHPVELRTPHVPPFPASPTVSVPLPNDANQLDYIELFLNTQLTTYIVECTNVYMRQPGSVRCLRVGSCCSGPGNKPLLTR